MDFFSVLSHLDWSQVGQLTLQHLLLQWLQRILTPKGLRASAH